MFKIEIDISDITSLKSLEINLDKKVEEFGRLVAEATYGHVLEEAEKKLHSRKPEYIENLSIGKDGDVFFVILDASARWIDDGTPSMNLLESLLSSPKAKISKSGNRFLSVPFKQNDENPPAKSQNLVQAVKAHLAEKNISWDKVDTNSDGSVKEGLIHRSDAKGPTRASPSGTSYQGKGGFGEEVQGSSGIPFLKGVAVYQKKIKDKQGQDKVQRFIGTFRTASDSQRGKDVWNRPEIPGVHIFEETEQWLEEYMGKLVKSSAFNSILNSAF